MAPVPFCHLHVHSEYSLLDGANKIDALAERAAKLDQPAIALTDHGVMNGAVELYSAAQKHGIKPIVGCEVYFVDDHKIAGDRRSERNHLTLLASSTTGYRNLVALCSRGFLDGYQRGKPTVDMELIAQHSEGVIGLSGCLQSRFARRVIDGKEAEAREHMELLAEVLGRENIYFEVQPNAIPEQKILNEAAFKFGREWGRPVAATADAHYLDGSEQCFGNHQALLCVQTKSTLENPKMSFSGNEYYIKSAEQMAADLKRDHPDLSASDIEAALTSTVEIAERCSLEIELDRRLIPSFETPDELSEADYLRKLVFEGLTVRYGDPLPTEARERADQELEVIDRMGFSAYFLIVWDFVDFAKNNGVAVGPGRGSAAGSIVAYSLRITDVDPLANDLLFERFLNPERVSMPDIDIDFSVRGRERVLHYVTEKYGRERVAQIITFGKMKPRQATRDAARVLGFDYATGDRLVKLIPEPIQGRAPDFENCLKPGQPLRKAYDEDTDAKKIIDVASGLEGIVRNASIHAAAVVIADRPLTEVVPLQIADAGLDENGDRVHQVVTQFSMVPVEQIGLLKMDFLGLRNLDVIEDALDIIEDSTGARPDMANLPLDDANTYAMLARGDAMGVFQFESEGMREALKKVRPTEFEDLVALVSLYRPGAMAYIDTYARGKREPDAISYRDERLRPILQSTYNVILYQEQAMQISKEIAGFSAARADDLRKAIGKKNQAAMAKLQPEFVTGCAASGTDRDVTDWLWQVNEASASYSFNKSHAACYGLISYRTAYLKANYPSEYLAALISSVMSSKDQVPKYVSLCDEMGIAVLPPDVNSSDHEFRVVDNDIRFGLDAVKGVGHQAVEGIKQAREEEGPFTSIFNFCERVSSKAVNKKALEALIKGGALDSTGATRKGMLGVLEQAQAAGQKSQQDAEIGQGSFFDAGDGPDSTSKPAEPPIPVGEFDQSELLRNEKEAIGIFLSAHPLKEMRPLLRERTDCKLSVLRTKRDGETVTVGGILTQTRKIKTRKGADMMFAKLSDLEEQIELVIFQQVLESAGETLETDNVVLVKGRIDQKGEGETCIIVSSVEGFEATEEELAAAREKEPAEPAAADVGAIPANGSDSNGAALAASSSGEGPAHGGQLRLVVPAEKLAGDGMDELRKLIQDHPGDAEVVLDVLLGDQTRSIKLGSEYRVRQGPTFEAELDTLLGVA